MPIQFNASPATEVSGSNTGHSSFLSRIAQNVGGERIARALLLAAAVLLTFYNLRLNPRPWFDEGGALSVAKSIATDGVYAGLNSDSYETFGAVQSIGPTVLVPVALSFKLFGVGLLQARLVAGLYAVAALLMFYLTGRLLFGRWAALLAMILFLGSHAVGFYLYGRPVFGDIVALAFFLAGWLTWMQSLRAKGRWTIVLAGILFGLTMVTKSRYMILIPGTLVVLGLLDLLYYRQHIWRGLIIMGIISLACMGAWYGWQALYYGVDTFRGNLAKLGQLAAGTAGLSTHSIGDAIKFWISPSAGYFYFFWGFVALPYIGLLCLKRDRQTVPLTFLWLSTCLWILYFTVGAYPQPRNAVPPAAIAALFVGKLWYDLSIGLFAALPAVWADIRKAASSGVSLPRGTLVSVGAGVAVITMALLSLYQLQQTIRADVLDTVGREPQLALSPYGFRDPNEVAEFLELTVPRDQLIETWERELGILTDHRYHYPDQTLLASGLGALYGNTSGNYQLGADYFGVVKPAYVVVGWFARTNALYDMEFLSKHAKLVGTAGEGDWRYDVYQMNSQ